MHSANRITESSNAEASTTEDAARQSLSLLQRLRNVISALCKKNFKQEQPLDNLLLENESFATELKELNHDIPKENNNKGYYTIGGNGASG
ncbi:MAG: hypothetical protein AB2693_15965, partial [Candidatus Thiodiazotropha sp.]